MSDTKHESANETVVDHVDGSHDDGTAMFTAVSDTEPRLECLYVSDRMRENESLANNSNYQKKDLSVCYGDEKTNTNIDDQQNTNNSNNTHVFATVKKIKIQPSNSQLSSNTSSSLIKKETSAAIIAKPKKSKVVSETDIVVKSSNKNFDFKRPYDKDEVRELKPKKHRRRSKGKNEAPWLISGKNVDRSKSIRPSSADLSGNIPKVPPLKIVIPLTALKMCNNGKNGNFTFPYVVTSLEKSSASISKPYLPKIKRIAISNAASKKDEKTTQSEILQTNRHSDNNIEKSKISISTITKDLDISKNIIMSTHSKQTKNVLSNVSEDNKLKIDTVADTVSTISESTSIVESHKLSKIRELVIKWSEHYFKGYRGPGYFDQFDKSLIVFNEYQLISILKKQIDDKRKKLFAVHPKPPSGFKDYLLNRRTYVLAGNPRSSIVEVLRPPPANLHEQLRKLFVEQEKERQKLSAQHIVEKEKLVLNIEQEILRVHGRAARALANQQYPFSVCTILSDEEVCHIKDEKQLEYENGKQEEYSTDIFLSWLKELDDKWENIKESMLFRHHNEADSLYAVQKMFWEWKFNELSLYTNSIKLNIDKDHVPIVSVSDNFDIFPA